MMNTTGAQVRNLAGLTALALLAGCISLAGKAPKLLIGLTPDRTAAAGAMTGGKVGAALVVLDPQGKVIKQQSGYIPGGPKGFIDWLNSPK